MDAHGRVRGAVGSGSPLAGAARRCRALARPVAAGVMQRAFTGPTNAGDSKRERLNY